MKFTFVKNLFLSTTVCFAFTACTHTPTQTTSAPRILEQVQNIAVYPQTQNNQAKLIKYQDRCIIEFTGFLAAGQAIEQWSFKGNQLLAAQTQLWTDSNTPLVNHFDLQDPVKQANFVALKHNFQHYNLIQCR